MVAAGASRTCGAAPREVARLWRPRSRGANGSIRSGGGGIPPGGLRGAASRAGAVDLFAMRWPLHLPGAGGRRGWWRGRLGGWPRPHLGSHVRRGCYTCRDSGRGNYASARRRPYRRGGLWRHTEGRGSALVELVGFSAEGLVACVWSCRLRRGGCSLAVASCWAFAVAVEELSK